MNLAAVPGQFKHFLRRHTKRALQPVAQRLASSPSALPESEWRLVRNGRGSLMLGGVELATLFATHGSPLHVVDAARLADNAARFTARPAGAVARPEVFYSYKTNPVPGALQFLHARGLGAEVVSAYELWLALRLGVAPAAIVYNGPVKSVESLQEAVRRGIGLINVNCLSELPQLAAIARAAGKRARVGVRVTFPGGWSGQFGERAETGAALRAFAEARDLPDLDVVAVHAHLGGEIATRERLDGFLSSVLAFADEVRARLGIDVEILDLGGGLACPTVVHASAATLRLAKTFACEPAARPPEAVLSIGDYVAHALARVDAHYAALGQRPPRVFFEPGRAVTGNAQLLLCRVAQVRAAGEDGLTWAVLDAGINVADAVRNEYHQIFALSPRPDARQRLYRLAGPTCTPGDVLYAAITLPELAEGDGLAIMDAGAYFVPYSTSFSFPQPGIVMIVEGRVERLRRRETFEDLVALDQLVP